MYAFVHQNDENAYFGSTSHFNIILYPITYYVRNNFWRCVGRIRVDCTIFIFDFLHTIYCFFLKQYFIVERVHKKSNRMENIIFFQQRDFVHSYTIAKPRFLFFLKNLFISSLFANEPNFLYKTLSAENKPLMLKKESRVKNEEKTIPDPKRSLAILKKEKCPILAIQF